jgi:glyoxylase-like metal-dependent hydrolase (beta-lactamase superfamily II)
VKGKKMIQPTITVDKLSEILEHGQPVILLDIRRPAERAEWTIPGSLHVDAYDALRAGDPSALSGVDLPKDRPVVTVCMSGKTSLIAAQVLRSRGFEASSLAGGMRAWSMAWNSAEYTVPGTEIKIVQVRRTGKGCLSYLVCSTGKAAVIDPSLGPEVYLELVHGCGCAIEAVIDTHIHADHLSRARELSEQCGCTLYLPEQERVSFPFTAIRGGDALRIGEARFTAIHTPGHTIESLCLLLDAQTPALFTGDTLFLEGVGRPDLAANPEESRHRAKLLYRSLQELLSMPHETFILPGHTSQPVAFDYKVLGASFEDVRRQVALLRESEGVFVNELLAHIPQTPPNHHRILELNEGTAVFKGDPVELEAGPNRCAVI